MKIRPSLTVGAALVAAAAVAVPAQAAKPSAPSGAYTAVTSQGRPFHLGVKHGRITVIYADLVVHCVSPTQTTGQGIAQTGAQLGAGARLRRTAAVYTFSTDDDTVVNASGRFSRNGRSVRVTIVSSEISPPTAPGATPQVCGTTVGSDGTPSGNSITVTARRD
jgi:hypothetical protein